MSDPYTWQSPGGTPSGPPPVAPPPYGQQPAFVPPPTPASPLGSAPGWTPPPKPGLIPLRPLTLGTMLGASFQVMRRNPRPTFGISLGLNAAAFLLFVIVVVGWVAFAVGRVSSAAVSDQGDIIAGSFLGGGITLLVPFAGSIVVTALVQGVISMEVARATLGEKNTATELFRRARGRIGALIGWSFMLVGAFLILYVLAIVVIGAIIALGGVAGIVIGVILTIGALLVFVVGYAWIGTKVSLVPSILMIERIPLRKAIVRSWTLTNRSFWKTLGIELLVQVIVSTASQVITVPISLLFGFVAPLIAPTGDESTFITMVIVLYAVIGVLSLFVAVITTVMASSTATLIYLDLRMRKEGLDLELIRYVEARQSGDPSVTDPYLDVKPQERPAPVWSPAV
jgi:MFS family permease